MTSYVTTVQLGELVIAQKAEKASKQAATSRRSDSVGLLPRLSTNAVIISPDTGSFRTFGFARKQGLLKPLKSEREHQTSIDEKTHSSSNSCCVVVVIVHTLPWIVSSLKLSNVVSGVHERSLVGAVRRAGSKVRTHHSVYNLLGTYWFSISWSLGLSHGYHTEEKSDEK